MKHFILEKAQPEHKQTWTVQRKGKTVTAHRKAQLRSPSETLKPFSSVLRQMGFKLESKDYTPWGNTHLWHKVDPENRMKISIGLEDYKGKQSGRISHWHMPKGAIGEGRNPHDPDSYGTMDTPPTNFTTPEEMKTAIDVEVSKYKQRYRQGE